MVSQPRPVYALWYPEQHHGFWWLGMRSNTDCCTPMFQTGQVEFGGFIKIRFFGVPIVGIVVFWGR